MPRFLVGVLAALGLAAVLAPASAVRAAPLDVAGALAERSIGKADAPVVIYEYMSLNCPHCATFHTDTFPKIKAAYIDTGKARMVINDFPLDDIALVGHMLARCARPDKFFGMIGAIFSAQPQWRHSETPREDLMKIAQLSGMSAKETEDCVDNDALRTGIEAAAAVAHDKHAIKSTPSFLIDGTRVPGALPFEDFQDIIDKALARKAGGR